MQRKQFEKKAVLKVVMLFTFIISAIVLVRFTPLKEFLTMENLSRSLQMMRIWAPIAFIVIYALGVCLFVPGTVLGTIGALLFGTYWGFVYIWFGAMIGAYLAFHIGRYLGRDFAASLVGSRLKRYDDAIERNGFATVLYLRLIYFPFTPMNFGMGLTKVHFWDYILGTALGITVGTFIFTFFIGTLRGVWVSGRWADLLSWQVFISLGLFIFSFFIPKLLKMVREKQEVEDA